MLLGSITLSNKKIDRDVNLIVPQTAMCTFLICSISREVFIIRCTHNFKLIDVAILWYVQRVSCFSATMGASCYPLDLSLYPTLKFNVLFIILGSNRIYIGVCSLWQVMPLKQHRLIVDCVINACLQSTLSIQLCQVVYVDQFTAAYHACKADLHVNIWYQQGIVTHSYNTLYS